MAYIQKGDNPITRTKSDKKVLPIDDMSNYEYDYDQNEDITTAPKTKEEKRKQRKIKKAVRVSERQGESGGGIDYSSKKVQKILNIKSW